MSKRISEKELKIPALQLIKDNPGITTSELIEKLYEIIKPTGKDIEIISGRNDTYFSQKVRNLKSHDTLKKYTIYVEGKWTITYDGLKYFNDNIDTVKSVDYVIENTGYDYEDKLNYLSLAEETVEYGKEKLFVYEENDTIIEGVAKEKNIVVRERSRKLRNVAVAVNTIDGRIKCLVCGFDFEVKYGDIGKGFIEIHHKIPVYQYEQDDTDKIIKDALINLVPVCSNCHRMIHRAKTLSFEEFKKLVKERNNI